MLFNKLRRFVTWFTRSHAKTVSDQSSNSESTSSAFEFDPMWHGDHWQNLLSSPMDARRYVMEDWSVSASPGWDEIEGNVPAH